MDFEDIKRVNRPAIAPTEAKQEVDATPTGEGMQVAISKPVTHEKAPPDQYSSMFTAWRQAILAAAQFVAQAPNIPKYWGVYVNANSAAGALVQVIAGSFDITLPVGGHVVFPGRTMTLTLAVTVANADVTIVNLGDDRLIF